MKYFIFLIGVVFTSCRENQPEYSLSRPEPGDRIVVVEEFSGVRCPNCPEGTKELENLRELYNDQIIIVTIHAGDFAFTYPQSKFDFTTAEGNTLLKLLGNPIGYPSAVINRAPNNNGSLQAFSSQWGSLIADAIEEEPSVSLSLDIEYDLSTRELDLLIGSVPNRDFDEELRLTVLIKEDNMVDWQSDSEVPQGVDQAYNHRNVLRKILSDTQGDQLAENAMAFEKIEKNYQFTLPSESDWWIDRHLTLVAFITDSSGRILQGVEKPLIP